MHCYALLLALGFAGTLAAAEGPAAYEPWPVEAVKVFARIPVQDDGRVKPLLTVAYWTLIELSGKSSLSTVDPEEARQKPGSTPPGREDVPRKLSATAWLMDVLFRPEWAREYPVFLVDDSSAVTAIGAQAKHKKRNYYSYQELLPGRPKLAELAADFEQKAARQERLTALEDQILMLSRKVNTFELLASAFSPAQPSRILNPGFLDADMLKLMERLQISGLLDHLPKMLAVPFNLGVVLEQVMGI